MGFKDYRAWASSSEVFFQIWGFGASEPQAVRLGSLG